MSPADELLARAVLWRWAARAFWYPEADLLAALRDPAVRSELSAAAAASGAGEAVAAALAGLWAAADTLEATRPSLPEEHTFLFSRQVAASPHETSYAPRPGADRARGIAELGSFYAAFGFQVSAARPELPDHVSVECEFVAVLLAKEAYALAQEWADRARLTREARQRFLAEHPALWFPTLEERLAQHARLAFYPAVAALVLALLAAEPASPHAARGRSRSRGRGGGTP